METCLPTTVSPLRVRRYRPVHGLEVVVCSRREFVVLLHGEFDLQARPELERELEQIAGTAARRVVVDLTAASFVDAATLGVLLRAQRRLDAAGGELILVCNDRHLLRILRLTLLDRAFTIYEHRADAMRLFESRVAGPG